MDNIFFSIIIPTFNRATFLNKTINHVLSQTFLNFEVIVIDDGSTDDTFYVIDEISKKDNRIFYFYQNNAERAVARNNGASKARGKYLIFLDSDDFFSSKDHLKEIYGYLVSNNEIEGLYFTGAIVQFEKEFIYTRDFALEELNQIDFFVKESIVPARVCIPKSVINLFEFDKDCIVVEDTVLWTAIMENHPVYYVPIHSVTYCLHDNNSVNTKKSNAYKKRLKGLKKLFNNYSVGTKIPKKTKDYQLNRCYYGISEYYLNNKKVFWSKYWVLISIIKYPFIEIKHKVKMLVFQW